MDGGRFEVVLKVGAGRSQRRAAAQGRYLVPLPAIPSHIKVMLVGNLIVQPGDAIVAVTEFSDGAEEVVQRCRKTGNRSRAGSGPESLSRVGASRRNLTSRKLARKRSKSIARRQADRDAICRENSSGVRHPG